MKILIFILMFLVISSLIIINNNNLKVFEKEDFHKFSKIYTNWVDKVFLNLRIITGNAVKLEWFPE